MANANSNQLPTNPVERSLNLLNQRLGLNTRETALSANLASCYGGWRLEAAGGSTGFACNNGTEARMPRKEFLAYLRGIHDALDHIELNGGAA